MFFFFHLYKPFLGLPSDTLLTLIGLDTVQAQSLNCILSLSLQANKRQNNCFGGFNRCANVYFVCWFGVPINVKAVWPVAEIPNLTLKSPVLLGISSLKQAFHTGERSLLLWLDMEVVSINILSIPLKKECMHTFSWEQSKSGVCEAPKAKHKANQGQICCLCSLWWLWLEVVRCLCFCWLFLCSSPALVYIVVFKLDVVK